MKDPIEREDAINALWSLDTEIDVILNKLKSLPSAQPEIVRCKDCVKHNIGVNDTPYKSYVCPLVKFRGKAQGHEFDYQYCVYGARKE